MKCQKIILFIAYLLLPFCVGAMEKREKREEGSVSNRWQLSYVPIRLEGSHTDCDSESDEPLTPKNLEDLFFSSDPSDDNKSDEEEQQNLPGMPLYEDEGNGRERRAVWREYQKRRQIAIKEFNKNWVKQYGQGKMIPTKQALLDRKTSIRTRIPQAILFMMKVVGWKVECIKERAVR
ncbi:MAG: hypothetical protein K0R76_895 [Alphaproteobacteria bacterium]|jgi:hypothetical protein|nr:hypothetical protein [Alphaproteobacteria bacterium]